MPPICPFFNGSIYWCSLPVPPVCGACRGRWFVSVGYRSLDWEAPYVRILTCTQTWYSWWDPQPCTAWCCSAVKLLKMGPLGRRWVYFARGRNINNLCLKDRLCVFFIHVMVPSNSFMVFPLRSCIYALPLKLGGFLKLFNSGSNSVWLLRLSRKGNVTSILLLGHSRLKPPYKSSLPALRLPCLKQPGLDQTEGRPGNTWGGKHPWSTPSHLNPHWSSMWI